jgi:OmpA-OmpF porin, OOP family
MKTKSARIAAVLACLIAAPPAAAAELGFYVGGQVGQASKEVSREFYELFNDDIQAFSGFTPVEDHTSLDDSDTAFAIVAGYRLNSYLAFEGGFTEFGQVTYKSRATGNFPLEGGTLNTNIESETSGFSLAALGTLPLTRDDTTETFAAVGISRRFFEIYDLRLEYLRVFDAGAESTGGKGDLDAALLGLNVTF